MQIEKLDPIWPCLLFKYYAWNYEFYEWETQLYLNESTLESLDPLMTKFLQSCIGLICLFLSTSISSNEEIQPYLTQFFSGYAYQFGYGSGISSNNPRVELVIHYCSSGYYYSFGQSCRPNLIAKGYQCTNIQDAGQWQVIVENGQGVMQWISNSSGPGSLPLYIRNDGSVADVRDNPFLRAGPAQCG